MAEEFMLSPLADPNMNGYIHSKGSTWLEKYRTNKWTQLKQIARYPHIFGEDSTLTEALTQLSLDRSPAARETAIKENLLSPHLQHLVNTPEQQEYFTHLDQVRKEADLSRRLAMNPFPGRLFQDKLQHYSDDKQQKEMEKWLKTLPPDEARNILEQRQKILTDHITTVVTRKQQEVIPLMRKERQLQQRIGPFKKILSAMKIEGEYINEEGSPNLYKASTPVAKKRPGQLPDPAEIHEELSSMGPRAQQLLAYRASLQFGNDDEIPDDMRHVRAKKTALVEGHYDKRTPASIVQEDPLIEQRLVSQRFLDQLNMGARDHGLKMGDTSLKTVPLHKHEDFQWNNDTTNWRDRSRFKDKKATPWKYKDWVLHESRRKDLTAFQNATDAQLTITRPSPFG
jgi:hypothetical protein